MILLGFGSNIGRREHNIRSAIHLLEDRGVLTVDKVSSLYETEPVGLKEQPVFLNAVISVFTPIPPGKLLAACQQVENDLGRVRSVRWGPRIIDIDLLMYNDLIIREKELTLPHPRLGERRFVLVPLAEIAAEQLINGCTVKELLRLVKDRSAVTLYRSLDLSREGI